VGAIAVVAFLNGAAWALITPAWHGPDEPDHFAYAQSVAERGQTPDKQQSDAPAFSTRSVVALDAARTYSVVGLGDTRPPWLDADEAHYRSRLARTPGREHDGGGFLYATSSHLPGYYLLTLPAYALADSQSTFSELTAMRLVSALLGAVAAMCAFLTVRELAPRREWLAVAAGVLVAFHPMLAFMFGVVNNDAAVNAGAALLVFLLVRGLRRGLSVPLAIALGATLALLPAMKATGAALYPAALVGIAGMVWRRRSTADLRGYGVLAGVAAAVLAIRAAVVSALEGPTAVVAGGVGGASVGGTITRVLEDPNTFFSYTWQMFLPRLWFMNDLHVQKWPAFDVFIEGGWAAFGWLVVRFPQWVYLVIAGVSILAAALCVVAVVRRRSQALRLGWELAVLLVAIAGVVGGVEAAYFTNSPRSVPAEQGRYIFTAAVPLAAIAVGAAMAFSERIAPLVATGLAAAVIGLSYASQLLALTGFFT
jgi:4-amino-4-deoxy-L-arabinose transferase-like glycosyltransferase